VKTVPDIDRRKSGLPFRANLDAFVEKKIICFKESAVTPTMYKYTCK
jgi:hypothetical protein